MIKCRTFLDGTMRYSDHTPFVVEKGVCFVNGAQAENLGMFTNCFDRAGRPIFEGDFLGNDSGFMKEKLAGNRESYLVGFDRGCFMAGRRLECPKSMDTYLWLICDKLEVIGNKHETPSLLTTKGWHVDKSGIDTRPNVVMRKDKEERPCPATETGVNCGFCSKVLVPMGGRITVTDTCKGCGAEVVDI